MSSVTVPNQKFDLTAQRFHRDFILVRKVGFGNGSPKKLNRSFFAQRSTTIGSNYSARILWRNWASKSSPVASATTTCFGPLLLERSFEKWIASGSVVGRTRTGSDCTVGRFWVQLSSDADLFCGIEGAWEPVDASADPFQKYFPCGV